MVETTTVGTKGPETSLSLIYIVVMLSSTRLSGTKFNPEGVKSWLLGEAGFEATLLDIVAHLKIPECHYLV